MTLEYPCVGTLGMVYIDWVYHLGPSKGLGPLVPLKPQFGVYKAGSLVWFTSLCPRAKQWDGQTKAISSQINNCSRRSFPVLGKQTDMGLSKDSWSNSPFFHVFQLWSRPSLQARWRSGGVAVSLLPGWARFSSWTCDPRLSPWISMLKWSNFGWCGGSHHFRKPPFCGKYQERFLAIVDDFRLIIWNDQASNQIKMMDEASILKIRFGRLQIDQMGSWSRVWSLLSHVGQGTKTDGLAIARDQPWPIELTFHWCGSGRQEIRSQLKSRNTWIF